MLFVLCRGFLPPGSLKALNRSGFRFLEGVDKWHNGAASCISSDAIEAQTSRLPGRSSSLRLRCGEVVDFSVTGSVVHSTLFSLASGLVEAFGFFILLNKKCNVDEPD